MQMQITATELKNNMEKYLLLAATQNIDITQNGKSIAKLSSATADKKAALDSLVGIAEACKDTTDVRAERLLQSDY